MPVMLYNLPLQPSSLNAIYPALVNSSINMSARYQTHRPRAPTLDRYYFPSSTSAPDPALLARQQESEDAKRERLYARIMESRGLSSPTLSSSSSQLMTREEKSIDRLVHHEVLAVVVEAVDEVEEVGAAVAKSRLHHQNRRPKSSKVSPN